MRINQIIVLFIIITFSGSDHKERLKGNKNNDNIMNKSKKFFSNIRG